MDFATALACLLVMLVSLILTYAYYMSRDFGKLQRLGIKHPKPWPVLGNMLELAKVGFFQFHAGLYTQFKGEKVYGLCEPGRPTIVIRDLDILRDICMKNFNSFCDRRVFPTGTLFDKSVLNLRGDHWKYVRNKLTPTFSSGKVKQMGGHIEQTTKNLVDFLKKAREEGREVELWEILSCYTMDTIATSGFGVEINSIENRHGRFMMEAKKLLKISTLGIIIAMMFPFLTPILCRFGLLFLPKDALDFFTKFVDDTFEARKEDKTSGNRKDFIQLMVNEDSLKENDQSQTTGDASETRHGLTHEEIQAQAFILFIAGFDTVSRNLSFTLHLLAHHPECLRQVQEELDEVLGQEFPSYDNVQKLPYLDMCISESLRMYPPGFLLDRECVEDVSIQGIDFPKGMMIIFPVFAIHNDPDIWPEPDRFDPDRFTPENKASRHLFAFLPFGQGPRNCIGMRLAQLEVKMALAAILQEMTPVLSPKSVHPVTLEKNRLSAEEGLWVKFEKRKQD